MPLNIVLALTLNLQNKNVHYCEC